MPVDEYEAVLHYLPGPIPILAMDLARISMPWLSRMACRQCAFLVGVELGLGARVRVRVSVRVSVLG
jgi:hypothetical protein